MKISNRLICISCAFDHISDFWPQNDLFWPLRWPRMTSRCTPLNSEENFQSIDMHIVHIRYEINIISILTTRMSLIRALSLLSRPVALQKWDRRILRKICNQNLFFGVLHKPPSTGATRILEILELEKNSDRFKIISRFDDIHPKSLSCGFKMYFQVNLDR